MSIIDVIKASSNKPETINDVSDELCDACIDIIITDFKTLIYDTIIVEKGYVKTFNKSILKEYLNTNNKSFIREIIFATRENESYYINMLQTLKEQTSTIGVILIETKEQKKERLDLEKARKAAEKANKERLAAIKAANLEFIKFIKGLSFNPIVNTAIINRLNDMQYSHRICSMTINDDDSISFNYNRSDYTMIEFYVKADYVKSSIPVFLNTLKSNNIKTLLITQGQLRKLKNAKTSDVIQMSGSPDGILYELVKFQYNKEFEQEFINISNSTLEDMTKDTQIILEMATAGLIPQTLDKYKVYKLNKLCEKNKYDLDEYISHLKNTDEFDKVLLSKSDKLNNDFDPTEGNPDNIIVESTDYVYDIKKDLVTLSFNSYKNVMIPTSSMLTQLKGNDVKTKAYLYKNAIIKLICEDQNSIGTQYFRLVC